jgi:hypothetical protein
VSRPGAWNRFLYVLGNPIRYNDRFGHYYCEGEKTCTHNVYHTYSQSQLLDEVFSDYGVTLSGNWSIDNKYKAALGVTSDGRYLAGDLDSSAEKAFKKVYQSIEFQWTEECYGCRSQEDNDRCGSDFSVEHNCGASGAYTQSKNLIQFASMSGNIISGRNNVVHELGHAIAGALGGLPYTMTDKALRSGVLPGRPSISLDMGFASPIMQWQQSRTNINTYQEIWADQFLGTVFNTWETKNWILTNTAMVRSEWMTVTMTELLGGK